ncbi:MAG: phosphate-starvation-inducible PsiE family protein [Betaproteobacteria bacterium]|nr:phosphate-starvation-inducible PsiE family protein [Betaproteobacteria bacterium]
MAQEWQEQIDRAGRVLVDSFQLIALFVIGATIVWAAAYEYLQMIQAGRAKLDDILLLFIYLELGAMVGIYFKTDRLPVLFLLYVAVTAMTRFLVIDVKELTADNILIITRSILLLTLTLAVLVLQFASARFGAEREPKVTEH